MLRWVFIAWLVIQFIIGYQHGLPNAIMWTLLNAVVLLAIYGVYRLISGGVRKART